MADEQLQQAIEAYENAENCPHCENNNAENNCKTCVMQSNSKYNRWHELKGAIDDLRAACDQDVKEAAKVERKRLAQELRTRAYDDLQISRKNGKSESHAVELEVIASEIEGGHFVKNWRDTWITKEEFLRFVRGDSILPSNSQ